MSSFKKTFQVSPLFLGLCFAVTAGAVNAQGTGGQPKAMTRDEVKMELQEFTRTHRWDGATDNWVLKPGFEAPKGAVSRAEVIAQRNEFLRNHRWDGPTESWVPENKPRDLGKRTREEVRAETKGFLRTHTWDEAKGAWVDNPQAKKK